MTNKAVLFSIKPKYSSMILKGTKKYELRRKCPKISSGDLAIIYESSPTQSVVGAFTVGNIIEDDITRLWERVGSSSGIEYNTFVDYFMGMQKGYAIEVSTIWPFHEKISLDSLRTHDLEPPQSYRYIQQDAFDNLFKDLCLS